MKINELYDWIRALPIPEVDAVSAAARITNVISERTAAGFRLEDIKVDKQRGGNSREFGPSPPHAFGRLVFFRYSPAPNTEAGELRTAEWHYPFEIVPPEEDV